MMVQEVQKLLSEALNSQLPTEWAAFRATDRDGMEYIELSHEDTEQTFIITIQERIGG